MQRQLLVECALTQIYSFPSFPTLKLAAQLPDWSTKPVFAQSTSPCVSLSSILLRKMLDMVMPSGCSAVGDDV